MGLVWETLVRCRWGSSTSTLIKLMLYIRLCKGIQKLTFRLLAPSLEWLTLWWLSLCKTRFLIGHLRHQAAKMTVYLHELAYITVPASLFYTRRKSWVAKLNMSCIYLCCCLHTKNGISTLYNTLCHFAASRACFNWRLQCNSLL